MSLATIPLFAFGTCLVLHLVALRFFPKWGLLDFPERYGLSRSRLPYPTGILAVLTFLVFFIAIFPLTIQNMGLIAGIILLAGSCFIDDRKPLPPALRLTIQILAAFLIFATGSCIGSQICSITNPLSGFIGAANIDLTIWKIGVIPVLGALFTLLWLGLTINALNWFDGIPGQVSTLSALGFLTIGFLSLSSRVDQPAVALLSFILCGIATACLLFDFPPPKVIPGDSGAMFFGLMLGVLTVYAGGKVATAFLVLGVPLIDAFIVVVRRILQGKSPLKGSLSGEHLHHRLLAKGWHPRVIILLTALLGSGFGIAALFMSTLEKFIAAIVMFVIILGLSWYARPKKSTSW